MGVAARAPRAWSSRRGAWVERWQALARETEAAATAAINAHPRSEVAVLRAALGALPPGAALQIGNSLPIRAIDHVPVAEHGLGAPGRPAISRAAQRGRRRDRWADRLGRRGDARRRAGLARARRRQLRARPGRPARRAAPPRRSRSSCSTTPAARSSPACRSRAAAWRARSTSTGARRARRRPGRGRATRGLRATTVLSAPTVAAVVADALAPPGVTVIHTPVTPSGAPRRAARRDRALRQRSPMSDIVWKRHLGHEDITYDLPRGHREGHDQPARGPQRVPAADGRPR